MPARAGATTRADYTVAGLSGTRTFQSAYDTADRLTSLTYPTVGGVTEQLTYSYDEAWRAQSVCSNRPNTLCYVTNNVQYSALDQAIQWQFGNGLYQTWFYTSPMRRLAQNQVGTA